MTKSKNKHLPIWYKMLIERRLKKLEAALAYIDRAEISIAKGFENYSLQCIRKAHKELSHGTS